MIELEAESVKQIMYAADVKLQPHYLGAYALAEDDVTQLIAAAYEAGLEGRFGIRCIGHVEASITDIAE